jgi:hypothetical protein
VNSLISIFRQKITDKQEFGYLPLHPIEYCYRFLDIVLIDYKMAGHKSGVDMAIKILTIYPLFPILFIKGYGQSLMVF